MATSPSSAVQRLREIANQLRALLETYEIQSINDRAAAADRLLCDAIDKEAFRGPEHAVLQVLIAQQRDQSGAWQDRPWLQAIRCLLPDMLSDMLDLYDMGQHSAVLDATLRPVADLIDAEAAKLETEGNGGADPPTPPADKPEQGKGTGGKPSSKPRGELIADLEPADRKAYFAHSWTEGKMMEAGTNHVTDREAYDWLQENGLPDEKDSPKLANEFVGYRLPFFDTWSKQVRNARKVLGEQKHTPRAGRPTGGSIVKVNEIERGRE